MATPTLLRAIGKLAIAGEQAEFSVEQMIGLLNNGLSVDTLLDLISWRHEARRPTRLPGFSSAGMM